MTGMVGAFRSGAWLTKRRMRDYSIILLAYYVLIFLVIFLTAHGDLDTANRPIGTDFSQGWVAGRSALAGHPESAFNATTHAAAQERTFGHGTPFYGWYYPPYFLMIATALAVLPYLPSLIVWQSITLALYLYAVLRILRRPPVLLCAAAFPAVYVNLGHGQNGFLTAALLSFGCLWLGRRDWLAGLMFGLVAYKPQLGLVVPVALVSAGAWRSIAAATATVAVMTAATIGWFGTGVWHVFFDNLGFTRTVVLEEGNVGWTKLQSAFAAVRMQGGSVGLAYVVQSAMSLAVLGLLGWLWHGKADRRLKAAALLPAALLTTPYCFDYDMMLLGPAIAFIAAVILERGARNWEMTALAAVWLSPLVARVGGDALHLPIGLVAILGLFGMAVSRGLRKEGLLF